MKTIFYNHPIGTPKVCFTVSDKSVTELKKRGSYTYEIGKRFL